MGFGVAARRAAAALRRALGHSVPTRPLPRPPRVLPRPGLPTAGADGRAPNGDATNASDAGARRAASELRQGNGSHSPARPLSSPPRALPRPGLPTAGADGRAPNGDASKAPDAGARRAASELQRGNGPARPLSSPPRALLGAGRRLLAPARGPALPPRAATSLRGMSCRSPKCKKVCLFDPVQMNERLSSMEEQLKKMTSDNALITETVQKISTKQLEEPKQDWGSMTIRGRPVNLPGAISLFWNLYDEIKGSF